MRVPGQLRDATPPPGEKAATEPEPTTGRALPVGSPSCCCPSAAAVTVVLSSHGVAAGEFLLCAHHYRSLRPVLTERNALVYGRDGCLLDVANDPYWS